MCMKSAGAHRWLASDPRGDRPVRAVALRERDQQVQRGALEGVLRELFGRRVCSLVTSAG